MNNPTAAQKIIAAKTDSADPELTLSNWIDLSRAMYELTRNHDSVKHAEPERWTPAGQMIAYYLDEAQTGNQRPPGTAVPLHERYRNAPRTLSALDAAYDSAISRMTETLKDHEAAQWVQMDPEIVVTAAQDIKNQLMVIARGQQPAVGRA
jgi:hypothetical protein